MGLFQPIPTSESPSDRTRPLADRMRPRTLDEFAGQELPFRRQVELPIMYKGLKLDCGYKIDVIVQDTVILELKSIDKLHPIHEAQLLTYLRLTQKPVGLFNQF